MFNQKMKKARRWGYSLGVLTVLTGGIFAMTESVSAARAGGGIGNTITSRPYYVVRTIHYVYEDGATAAPDALEALVFSIHNDEGNTVWGVRSVIPADSPYTIVLNDETFDAVTSPMISDYTADQVTVPEIASVRPSMTTDEFDTVVGSSYAENIEVTVTYKKNAKIPAPAEEVTSPPAEETPVDSVNTTQIGELENLTQVTAEPIVTAPVNNEGKTKSVSVLPSTGEENSRTALMVGTATMLAAGMIGVAARLKRKSN